MHLHASVVLLLPHLIHYFTQSLKLFRHRFDLVGLLFCKAIKLALKYCLFQLECQFLPNLFLNFAELLLHLSLLDIGFGILVDPIKFFFKALDLLFLNELHALVLQFGELWHQDIALQALFDQVEVLLHCGM